MATCVALRCGVLCFVSFNDTQRVAPDATFETLSEELATNPFLRAGLAEVKSLLNMPNADDAEVFAEIRRRKDSF